MDGKAKGQQVTQLTALDCLSLSLHTNRDTQYATVWYMLNNDALVAVAGAIGCCPHAALRCHSWGT